MVHIREREVVENPKSKQQFLPFRGGIHLRDRWGASRSFSKRSVVLISNSDIPHGSQLCLSTPVAMEGQAGLETVKEPSWISSDWKKVQPLLEDVQAPTILLVKESKFQDFFEEHVFFFAATHDQES